MNGKTPEDADEKDQECEHCGMWFTPQGIHNHERNCPLKETNQRVIPPTGEAVGTADSVGGDSASEPTADEAEGTETQSGGTDAGVTDVTPTDREAGLPLADPDDDGPNFLAQSEKDGESTRTDGGDTADDCPECGHPNYIDAGEFLVERGDELNVNERELLVSHERVCASPNCKEVYSP